MLNLILNIPTDIYNIYIKFLSNQELNNFIINKEIYKYIKKKLKERYNLYKIQKFLKCYLFINNNLKKSRYSFSMINYNKEIIIEILAKSVHNNKDCFREMIHHTKYFSYNNVFHNHTHWYNKNKKILKKRVFYLIMNGYVFDNDCIISKQPNFKNLRIL